MTSDTVGLVTSKKTTKTTSSPAGQTELVNFCITCPTLNVLQVNFVIKTKKVRSHMRRDVWHDMSLTPVAWRVKCDVCLTTLFVTTVVRTVTPGPGFILSTAGLLAVVGAVVEGVDARWVRGSRDGHRAVQHLATALRVLQPFARAGDLQVALTPAQRRIMAGDLWS